MKQSALRGNMPSMRQVGRASASADRQFPDFACAPSGRTLADGYGASWPTEKRTAVQETIKLEEVFKIGGTPTHTFVHPVEYPSLLVALRTPGRGVVIEGPSGIGKTTSVTKALSELCLADKVVSLSARKPEEVELIQDLPNIRDFGTVIIDDFHRLAGC
jgi:hypothetical protein